MLLQSALSRTYLLPVEVKRALLLLNLLKFTDCFKFDPDRLLSLPQSFGLLFAIFRFEHLNCPLTEILCPCDDRGKVTILLEISLARLSEAHTLLSEGFSVLLDNLDAVLTRIDSSHLAG